MEWLPAPGDRIKTVITKTKEHELVYLNNDTTICSTMTNEFLILTSEWIPWSHQIIDFLSRQRGSHRGQVLARLMAFEKQHMELDFDELCLLFLEQELSDNSTYFWSSK